MMNNPIAPSLQLRISGCPGLEELGYLPIFPRPHNPNSLLSNDPILGKQVGHLEVQVEGAPSGAFLRIRTPVAHKRFVRILFDARDGWMDACVLGEWTIPVAGSELVRLRVVAENFARPGRHRVAEWSGEFDLRISLLGDNVQPLARIKVHCQVAPFLLASSLDPVDTVYMIGSSLTTDFVAAMDQIVPLCNARTQALSFNESVPSDIWAQDCMEMGVVSAPVNGELQKTAVLTGVRGRHSGIRAAPLDQNVRHHFHANNTITLDVADSRYHTRWIDWFGNLEVTPPYTASDGQQYPFGRIVCGKQADLQLHPEVLKFLQCQGYQWPPLELDVSFLTIGHVDEVVNFLPANTATGFTIMVPSVRAARQALFSMVGQGFGDTKLFDDTSVVTTLEKLYRKIAMNEENSAAELRLSAICNQLIEEFGIERVDVIDVPVLYADGIAIFPNMVNCLVCNRNVIVPDTCGPLFGSRDLFAAQVIDRVKALGLNVHVVDVWEPFHVRSGEVHCATNASRLRSNADWWNYDPKTRLRITEDQQKLSSRDDA
ncbi:MAG: protein-arginine deiminase family protein [Chthonomonadales bacterium]